NALLRNRACSVSDASSQPGPDLQLLHPASSYKLADPAADLAARPGPVEPPDDGTGSRSSGHAGGPERGSEQCASPHPGRRTGLRPDLATDPGPALLGPDLPGRVDHGLGFVEILPVVLLAEHAPGLLGQ